MTSFSHRVTVITVLFSQAVYSASEEEGQVVVLLSVLGQSDIIIHNQLRLQIMAQSATRKSSYPMMYMTLSAVPFNS